jgi:D-methionine transport system ATP-binding protein
VIEFKQVTKTFHSGNQTVTALDNVNLHVARGEIYGVIGFSGAGKSTLIRSANLLERPTSGEVLINGVNLATLKSRELQKAKRNIGMIFQHFNLLQSKTVFDNVATPLKLTRTPKADIRKRVTELLSFVGLSDKADNYPEQLSGGQKQRIGIARALATNPEVLLCDEATSALDPDTTSSILQLLKKINIEYNITILMITHEMSVIREICDKVAVMEKGRIIEEGSVLSIFSNPQHPTTEKFVRSIIPTGLPARVKEALQQKEPNRRIYEVTVTGDSSHSDLLRSLIQTFGIEVDILHATMNDIQGTSFGRIYFDLRAEPEILPEASNYLKSHPLQPKEVTGDARVAA